MERYVSIPPKKLITKGMKLTKEGANKVTTVSYKRFWRFLEDNDLYMDRISSKACHIVWSNRYKQIEYGTMCVVNGGADCVVVLYNEVVGN